jgi:hypothetical protein
MFLKEEAMLLQSLFRKPINSPDDPFRKSTIFDPSTKIEILEDVGRSEGEAQSFSVRICCSARRAEEVRDFIDQDTRLKLESAKMVDHPGIMKYVLSLTLALDIEPEDPDYLRLNREAVGFVWQGIRSGFTDLILGRVKPEKPGELFHLPDHRS